MKRLLLIASAAAVLSSCAVTRTRTARTVDLDSEITQMPTVVELDIAETREYSEVFRWTNSLIQFNRRVSVRAMTDEAVAGLLERSGADVLVEPHVSVDRDIRLFATDYTLTVSGYPARYSSFRTATAEDIEKITAMRGPAERSPLRLADYLRTKSLAAPHGTVGTMSVAGIGDSAPRWTRKNGYMGMVDAGLILGSSDGREDGLHVSTTHGVLFANRFFLGIGVGYQHIPQYWSGYNRDNLWSHNYYDYRKTDMVNMFLNYRAYILKRKVSPFVDARIGLNYSSTEIAPDTSWGMYWDAGVGLSVGRFNVSGVYAQYAETDGFKIKIGITF